MNVTRPLVTGQRLDHHAIVWCTQNRQLLMRLQSPEALSASIMPAATQRKAIAASVSV